MPPQPGLQLVRRGGCLDRDSRGGGFHAAPREGRGSFPRTPGAARRSCRRSPSGRWSRRGVHRGQPGGPGRSTRAAPGGRAAPGRRRLASTAVSVLSLIESSFPRSSVEDYPRRSRIRATSKTPSRGRRPSDRPCPSRVGLTPIFVANPSLDRRTCGSPQYVRPVTHSKAEAAVLSSGQSGDTA